VHVIGTEFDVDWNPDTEELEVDVHRGLVKVAGPALADDQSVSAKQRLKVIYENSDGFEIARQDLSIRGPGEFLGARQSGEALLRFADLERDVALIEQARDAADELLQKDPAAAGRHLDRWLGGKQEFIKA